MPLKRFIHCNSIHDRLLGSIERTGDLYLGRLGIFPVSFDRTNVGRVGTLARTEANGNEQNHKQERTLHEQRWTKFDETSAEQNRIGPYRSQEREAVAVPDSSHLFSDYSPGPHFPLDILQPFGLK